MAYDETFQEIVNKTDMVELVSEFVTLEKAGANYRGLCPFHNENTPSFYVSQEKKIATCFGCHKTLDPIGFVAEVKRIPFKEAALYCANKAGVKVNFNSNVKKGPDLSKYYKIMDIAQEYYTKNLLETRGGLEAIDYLSKRGLDKDTIKKFGIGLSSDKPDIIYQLLKKVGTLELDMVDSGLVKSDNGRYYDLFTKRIMFPIKDADGHILGYSGRIYRPQDEGQPKYVNSNENIIFKKRQDLFNINNAIPYANKMHRMILCEGQMDVIAVARAGYDEAVCSMGTGLTKEQCELIKRYVPHLILMYDNDKAGIEASIKAIPLIRQAGLELRLIHLEGAKDADEYALKFGTDKLKEFIDTHQISDIEFRYIAATYNRDLLKENDFEAAKADVFNFLLNARSATTSERYLTKLSEASNTSLNALVADFNNFKRRNERRDVITPVRQHNGNFTNIRVDNKYEICQRRLIGYATMSKEWATKINDEINTYGFDETHFNLWAELYSTYYVFESKFDNDKFLALISRDKLMLDTFVSDINTLSNDYVSKYTETDLANCIDTINEYALLKKQEEIKTKIKSETDTEKIVALAGELSDIQKKIKKGQKTNGS